MFSLVAGVYEEWFAPTQLNLLVLGASGSGKTALLERLKVTQFTKKPKPSSSSASGSARNQQNDSVPESFLPIALRVPRHQLQAQLSSQSLQQLKKKKIQEEQEQLKQHKPKRRSFLACPAPAKYNKAKDDSSSDDEEEEDDVNSKEELQQQQVPAQNGLGRHSSLDISLEDVPIGESETSINGKNSHNNKVGGNIIQDGDKNEDGEEGEEDEEEQDDEDQEFDLKAKSRMLPLHKIRPTIGQNLGKVEMCGAQCRVWDLGGKMHDLWSRYYPDADAVVFVWKIVDDSDPIQRLGNEDDNESDDDDDDWPPVTAEQQLALLETVRASIADDVPFLIWGHWFPSPPSNSIGTTSTTTTTTSSGRVRKPKAYQYDEPYSTASLLPHYHNPLMTIYFGSAKTGAGIRSAMEWLIPTATRQKKFRDKS